MEGGHLYLSKVRIKQSAISTLKLLAFYISIGNINSLDGRMNVTETTV